MHSDQLICFVPLSQTPVIALVGNDACWSQIAREQVPILGSNVACGLAFTGLYVAYCTLIATILGISSAHTHTCNVSVGLYHLFGCLFTHLIHSLSSPLS